MKRLTVLAVFVVLTLGTSLAQSGGAKREVFPVTVDYSQTLEEMIVAGRYDWKHLEIAAKNFPLSLSRHGKKEKMQIELVRFPSDVGPDEVVRELYKMGLRPAKLSELLAFGAAYPEQQRKFAIVALGSSWWPRGGYRHAVLLDGYAYGRYLRLHWWGSSWCSPCRFAAVRK